VGKIRRLIHSLPTTYKCQRRRSWFGGHGECVGYTPKNIEKMSLFNQPNCAAVDSCIRHYNARFARIPVDRVCQILNKLGSGEDIFLWISVDGSKSEWSPSQILKQKKEQIACAFPLNNWYARSVYPIEFQGGPPTKWSMYSGNLLTLLLDRIAVMVLFEGVKVLDGIIDPVEQYAKFA
jgi:hypothetical protein